MKKFSKKKGEQVEDPIELEMKWAISLGVIRNRLGLSKSGSRSFRRGNPMSHEDYCLANSCQLYVVIGKLT